MLLEERGDDGKLVHKKTLAALAGSYLTDIQVQNGAGRPPTPTIVYETKEEKKKRTNAPTKTAYTPEQYGYTDMADMVAQEGQSVVNAMMAKGE